MMIKITMILVLIAALFFPNLYNPHPQPLQQSGTNQLLLFGLALKAVSFTYGGYQQTINFGEEVQNSKRTLPRGIFIGILVIITLYLTVNYSYYKIIGFTELKNTRGIAGLVIERMFGPNGKYVFSILLFLAVLAYVNVSLLSNPRVMYAMSVDGILPTAFQKKQEKKDVYTVSLTVYAATCVVVLFFADKFEQILSFSIFLDSIGMATSAASVFILRKRTRHLDNTGIYKMKLYPLMPLLFITTYVFVGTMIAITTPQYAIIGTSVLSVFMILYFIFKGRFRNHVK
jgi:APA family basic amino acid/polyamine antiporter